jgi:hypothetical protein
MSTQDQTSAQPAAPSKTAEKVAAKVAVAVAAVTGAYFEQKVKRTVSESILGQNISQLKSFDAVVGAKVTKLAGEGHSDRFNEAYVTLEAHYAPGKFLRLTGFSQNGALLRTLVGRKDISHVNAIGEPMAGFGMNVRELEVIKTDGTSEIIISDPNAKATAAPATL